MGRYRKVKCFTGLPLLARQKWVNEFVTQGEQRMSAKRKGQYHHLIVRYVWAKLNAGCTYVTEEEIVRKTRAVHARKVTRMERGN